MSVEFNNAYQEILLDNLMAVIKQNFVFQTQLKLNENLEKQKNDLINELNLLKNEFENVKKQASQIDVYKNKAEQNNFLLEEKNRIQVSLNDYMKKYASLENTNRNLEESNKSLTSENKNLQESLSEIDKKYESLEKELLKLKSAQENKNNTSKKPKINANQLFSTLESGDSF